MARQPNEQLRGVPSTNRLTRVQLRAAKMAAATLETPPQIAFQHSVLCQTSLPYRDPGPGVRVWERKQGAVHLLVTANKAFNPDIGQYVQMGLPCGPKSRLILAHLNAEALKTDSPEIDIEKNLSSFVKRIQKYSPNGREITAYKEQLSRISTAIISMTHLMDNRTAIQIDSKIVSVNLWLTKDEHRRILWPATLHLSQDYFSSLQKHAVPLDELALGGLSHSTMALDIYAWLAQRLHRVPHGKPQFVAWSALKEQFGAGLGQMNNFKRKFRVALGQVLAFYPRAKITGDDRGLMLYRSPPPIAKKRFLVDNPQD